MFLAQQGYNLNYPTQNQTTNNLNNNNFNLQQVPKIRQKQQRRNGGTEKDLASGNGTNTGGRIPKKQRRMRWIFRYRI